MALPRAHRLSGKKNFDAVFKQGKTVYDSFFFIKAIPNTLSRSRFGITVPARIVKSAVQRNRVRRLVAAALSEELSRIPSGFDVMIVLKKALPAGDNGIHHAVHAAIRAMVP